MMNERETDRMKWWGTRLHVDPRFCPYGKDGKPDILAVPIIDMFDYTENAFLSNFYPFEITYKDLTFATTEHAYQWEKPVEGCVDGVGKLWSDKIRFASTPTKTKGFGRRCSLRPDWEQVKLKIMKAVLIAKFRDTNLWPRLDATGDAYLIEGNTWHDNCFGICLKKDCERGCWEKRGQNYLGLFLMELRVILRSHQQQMDMLDKLENALIERGEPVE